MINRVILVGRLVRDPELRKTTSGVSVVSFTIAVDNRVKSASGEKTTSFIPVTAWNATADNVAKYVKKGALVGVDGRLNQRSYDAKDGRKVSIVEVIAESVQFLERAKSSSSSENGYEQDQSFSDNSSSSEDVQGIDATDDNLPF